MDTQKNSNSTLFKDLVYYFKNYRRWFFAPIIFTIFFIAAMLAITKIAPVMSPFIYTLF